MATTRIERTTQLVSSEALTYIRPITLSISAKLLKPNANMYAFFDGVSVDRFFTQTGKNKGDQLVADANGELVATFDIPSKTFNTGERLLVIQENPTYSAEGVVGAAEVRAKGKFSSVGVNQKYQTVETTVNTTTVEEVSRVAVPYGTLSGSSQRSDPLAQSFFTYGIDGGCFVTSIDLYFQAKDTIMPVWVELREMVNGSPSNNFISPWAIVTKAAASVTTSQDASVATNFKFSKMVRLEQDKDYCFVIQSKSANYRVWTSKLSEKSVETGKTVFEQPYNGSMFKSENNYTWTAEQTEDIKFVLYKAAFDTTKTSSLKFPIAANSAALDSTKFQTFTGSSYVYVQYPFKHGLDLNSKIAVSCDATGTYNGITGAQLNGTHAVFDVKTEYIAGFVVTGASATSSGPIKTGGLVKDIQVLDGGSGYDINNPPTVTIGGPGINAAASVVIKNGKIVDILITNEGTGYTTTPSVTITGVVGVGATAIAITDAKFVATSNRVYHAFNPAISHARPAKTDITATLQTTLAAFEGGTNVAYSAGKTYDVEIDKLTTFDNHLLMASRFNEQTLMANAPSTLLTVNMTSSNPNVSPVIDIGASRLNFSANQINNQQSNEDLTSANASGSVAAITLVGGGTGYASAPTVLIKGSTTGNDATATCTISGGAVNLITLVTPGSGYLSAPTVHFTGGSPTTVATATTTITAFNSEVAPYAGTALSRYLTKQQTLTSVSAGIRLFAVGYSNISSSFDVYIKTSLTTSGLNHDQQPWKILQCDQTRNKSEAPGQEKEYEFYLDNIAEFDVYSLKFVLRSQTPWDPPVISNYRAIVLAA